MRLPPPSASAITRMEEASAGCAGWKVKMQSWCGRAPIGRPGKRSLPLWHQPRHGQPPLRLRIEPDRLAA